MDLHNLNTGEEFLDKTIDYTRAISEYPKADTIIKYLEQGNKPKHIYTKSLNVGGIAIADKMETYLGDNALQSSHFKQAIITPLHFAFSLSDKKELEKVQGEKEYFKLGTYLHECILEPTKFDRVVVEPKYSLASKEGVSIGIDFWQEKVKSIDAEFDFFEFEKDFDIEKQAGKKEYLKALKEISGLRSVSAEHYLKIKILKKHYENYGNGILKKLLHHSKREISFYTEIQGLDVKVRPDALQFEENIGVNAVISVKSTASPDLKAFYYQSAKMNYDLSEGMYQEVISKVTGRDFNTTIMIMLQTVEPYGVAILVWSGEDIEMGKYKFQTALDIVKNSQEKGIYKGYEMYADNDFGLINMELPQWNNRELLPTKIN